LSRVVKRVYRIQADPVQETDMFKAELERVLNQLMEEEADTEGITEELNLLDPTVSDVTSSRALATVYRNNNSTMLDVRISVKMT